MRDLKILGVDTATKERLLTLADGQPMAAFLRQLSTDLIVDKEKEARKARFNDMRASLARVYTAKHWAKLREITGGELRPQDLDSISFSLAFTASIVVGGYGEGCLLDDSYDNEVKALMKEFCLEYVPVWCRDAVLQDIDRR